MESAVGREFYLPNCCHVWRMSSNLVNKPIRKNKETNRYHYIAQRVACDWMKEFITFEIIYVLRLSSAQTCYLLVIQQLVNTCIESIIIGGTVIKPLESVRNLGS